MRSGEQSCFRVSVITTDELKRDAIDIRASANNDADIVTCVVVLAERADRYLRVRQPRHQPRKNRFIVTNGIEQSVGRHIVRFTGETIIPPAQELTDLQAGDFDKGLMNENCGSLVAGSRSGGSSGRTGISITTQADEATQSAEFSVGTGVNFEPGRA